MKLWITGSKGLLGSTLLSKISALGTTRTEVDIADLNALRVFTKKHSGITHIVNCAAFSLVDLAETNKEEAYQANAVGPENLARIAKEMGAHLVHISTDYVFPGNLHRPLKEDDLIAPCNYYGQTKWEGEQRVLEVLPSACVLRTSWIFGGGGKNFVAKILHLMLSQNEIRLTNDQWGRPTYAPDLADAILKLLGRRGIYHFANAGVATKYEFGVGLREEALRLNFPVVTKSIVSVPGSAFPSPCQRPVYSAFDTSKIENELNIQIRPYREALQDYLCQQSVLFPISL